MNTHSRGRQRYRYIRLVAAWGISFLFTCGAYSNPILDNVSSGSATVQQTSTTTTINQTSQKAIINWNSFNIGAGEATHFQQPTGGVTLNRINPNQGASQIYGQLTATGQIILINPAGLYFAPGSYVNVGGMIATTGNISDQDFLNNYYHFQNTPGFNGSIINEGTIIAADHGLVALAGGSVQNNGMIQANMGQVALGSGNAFTLSFDNSGLINFTVDTATTERAVDQNGNELRDGVKNTGSLIADGGTILMSARSAQGVLDHAINMEGIAQARSVGVKNGEIILSGDMNGGINSNGKGSGLVRVAGKLDVSGKNAGEKGGKVQVSSQYVLLDTTANIDASGDLGGGIINIGGNFHGTGPLPNATGTVILSGAQLIADAIDSGNGGQVAVWADDTTRYYGNIFARGGANGGDGGYVEVSGSNYLDFNGAVDTTAANGLTGMLLLDPKDIVIATSGGSAYSEGVNNLFANNASGTTIITPASLSPVSSNLTLQANNDITVTDAINNPGSSSSWQLIFSAGRNININNNITLGSSLFMTANDNSAIGANRDAGSGNITVASGVSINVGTNTLRFAIDPNVAGSFTPGGITVNSGGTLTAGTLQFSMQDSINAGLLTMAANAAVSSGLNVQYTEDGSVISGIISGAGSIYYAGSGNGANLLISGANTYTGPTTVDNAVVTISGSSPFGNSSGATVYNGSALTLQNATVGNIGLTLGSDVPTVNFEGTNAYAGDISLAAATTSFQSTTNSTLTLSGIISELSAGLALDKSGSGTLTLSGANTYTGLTTVTSGTLIAGNTNALGTTGSGTTVSSGATLGVTANLAAEPISVTGTGVGGNGALLFYGSGGNISGPITLTGDTTIGNSSGTSTIYGDISGAFALTKVGAGEIWLGGNNTYSGLTNINVGSLRAVSTTALGSNAAGTVVADGATLSLDLSGTIAGESLNVQGTGLTATYGALTWGTSSSVWSGNITLAGDTLIKGYTTSTSLTLSGTVGGAFTLNKDGSGTTLILSNTGNTFSGLGISAGTVQLGAAGVLANTASVSLTNASGATLDLNNFSETIGSLSGGGTTGGEVALGSGTLTVGDASSTTYDGVISGTGSVIKQGSGTLTLSNANTYSGGTTLNAGALSLGNNTAMGTGGLNLASGTLQASTTGLTFGNTISFNGGAFGGSNDFTISGNVDSGDLIKNGSNTVTLTNSGNTYDGNTFLNAGTLSVSADGMLGTNSGLGNITFNGGRLQTTANFTLNSTRGISLGASGGTFDVASGTTLTYNGVIAGAGALAKISAGTLTLGGTNTYTGVTSTLAGTINVTSAAGLGATSGVTSVANGATLNFSSGLTYNAEPISISGTGVGGNGALIIANGATLPGNITLGGNTTFSNTSGEATISGNIVDFGGSRSITKIGAGGITLSGNNTYSGTTTISAGFIRAMSTTALGSSAGGTVVADGAALSLDLSGTIAGESLTVQGTGLSATYGAVTWGTGNSVWSGNVTLADNTLFQGYSPGTSLTLSGTISGAFTLTKRDAGSQTSLILSNTGNSFSGLTITSGIVQLGAAGVLSDTASVSLANTASAVLDLNSFNETIGNISGGGGSGGTVTLGSGTLTVGDASSTTYSGVISGTGGVTKQGSGTLTLSGANLYSGTTTVSAGTLSLGASNALNNSSGISVTSGAALDINFSSGTLGNTNAISLNGTGISSAGALTFTGTSAILANDITLGSASSIGGAGSGSLNGIISGAFALTKVGSSTITLAGANAYSGGTTLSAGTLSLGTATSLGSGTLALNAGTLNANTASINVGNAITLGGGSFSGSNDFTLSGVLSGTTLTQAGSNVLTLSGNNTYTGLTTINNGATLSAASANALGDIAGGTSLASGATLNINNVAIGAEAITSNSGTISATGTASLDGNIAATGTTTINGAGTLTLNGQISGSGGLTKSSAGSLTLAGANTYDGVTNINTGTLFVTNANALGSTVGGTNIANGGVLNITNVAIGNEAMTLNGGSNSILSTGTSALSGNITLAASSSLSSSGTLTLSGVINDGGNNFGILKKGAGTVILSGTNTFTGSTSLITGTLSLASSDAINNSSSISIASGTTLDLNFNNATLGNSSAISLNGTGAGGAGAITFSGTNSTLTNALTLAGNSSIGGAGSGTLGAITDGASSFSLTKEGSGTITLSGANTYDGGTTVSGGVLATSNNTALGSGNANISSGGTLQVNTGITLSNAVTLAGTGSSGQGALVGSGNATVSGALTLSNDATLGTLTSGDTLTLSNNINGAHALTIAGSGSTTLGNSIGNSVALTSITANSAVSLGNGSTTSTFTTTGAQAFNNAITLLGNTNINTTNSNITLGSTVNGANDLSLNAGGGTISLGGAIGGSTALNSFSATQTGALNDMTIAQNISTVNDINLSADNNLTINNANINSSSGTVNLTTTTGTSVLQQTGTGGITADTVAVDAGHHIYLTGDNHMSAIGAITHGSDIVINNTGPLDITGITNGTGDITVNNTGGAITQSGIISGTQLVSINNDAYAITLGLNNDVTGTIAFTNSGANNITFVNTAPTLTVGASTIGSGTLSITNTGEINQTGILTASGGNINMTTLSPDTTERNLTVGAAINTSGGSVNLNAANNNTNTASPLIVNAVIDTSAGTGGTFTIGGGVALNTAPIVGAGDITLQGNGLDITLGTLNFTSSVGFQAVRNIAVTGALTTSGGANLTLQGDYLNSGTGGVVITSAGSINSSGNVTLLGSDLNGFAGAGADSGIEVQSGASVTAAGTITMTENAGNGNIVLDGDISNSGSGAINFTTAGTGNIELGANVTSGSGDITFNGPTVLTADRTVDNGSGDITFADTLTGASNILTLKNNSSAGGSVNFNGDTTLLGLTTFAQPYSVAMNGSNNTITNATTFLNTNGVTLANTNTFTGGLTSTASTTTLNGALSATNNNITLGAVTLAGNSTVNAGSGTNTLGSVNGAFSLGLNSSTGNVMNGNINIGSLSTTGNGNDTFAGSTLTTTGNQTYNNALTLSGGTANLNGAAINFANTLTGAATALTVNASGALAFSGVTSLGSLNATGSSINLNGAPISTVNGQSYTGAINLSDDTVLTMTGNGTSTLAIMSGIASSPYTLTLQGAGTGNHTFDVNGSLASALNVIGNASGNNVFALNSGAFQTYNISALNAGSVSGANLGSVTFSNMPNITGGSNGNTFNMGSNLTIGGTISGRTVAGGVTNTLNFSSYTNAINVAFTSIYAGNVKFSNTLANIAVFNNINNMVNNSTANGSKITLSSGSSHNVTVSSSMTGAIVSSGNTFNFSNFQNMTSISGSDSVSFTDPSASIDYTNKTATMNGVTMNFIDFSQFNPGVTPPAPSTDSNENVAQIVIQPTTDTSTSSDTGNTSLTSTVSSVLSGSATSVTTTQPLQNNTNIFVGPACY